MIVIFDQTKPHIKTLIKNQQEEMGSAKAIMTLWVRWKKPIVPLIDLDPEEFEDTQDIEFEPADPYIRLEMSSNSLMTEFFEGSDINDLI